MDFANNGFNLGGEKNSSTKNTKSSLLVPFLYVQAQQRLLCEGRQIRHAEQPEF